MTHYAKLLKNYAVLLLILPLLVFTQACSDDDDIGLDGHGELS